MVTRYIVSYDIADPERLRRVHAVVIFLSLGSAERTELPEITTLGLVYRPQRRGSVVL